VTDLHTRIVAELDRLDLHRLTTLGKVADAVVKLHPPRRFGGLIWCEPCAAQQPCSTIRTIAEQLSVSVEGGE